MNKHNPPWTDIVKFTCRSTTQRWSRTLWDGTNKRQFRRWVKKILEGREISSLFIKNKNDQMPLKDKTLSPTGIVDKIWEIDHRCFVKSRYTYLTVVVKITSTTSWKFLDNGWLSPKGQKRRSPIRRPIYKRQNSITSPRDETSTALRETMTSRPILRSTVPMRHQ